MRPADFWNPIAKTDYGNDRPNPKIGRDSALGIPYSTTTTKHTPTMHLAGGLNGPTKTPTFIGSKNARNMPGASYFKALILWENLSGRQFPKCVFRWSRLVYFTMC
jgi:hypothetical protein